MDHATRKLEERTDGRKPVELSSGVDALYLSGHCRVEEEMLRTIGELRQVATETNVALPIGLGALTFAVAPHAWGKYRFCLDHQIGRIGISESRRLPQLRIQPRSEFLHAVGPSETINTFVRILEPHCSDLRLSTSRVDLYVDLEGWKIQAEDRRQFCCRAESIRTHEHGWRFSGFEFGSRRSNTICARIYDKTLEVAEKGNEWWFEIWGDRHHSGETVMRVEFEIGRQGLKEFGVDHPNAVIEATPSLWRYCSETWLTHRLPSEDQNRSRWKLSPAWEAIQVAKLCHPSVDLGRLRARARAGSLRKLMPGLTGYLVGFAVIVGTEDIDETCNALVRQLRRDEVEHRKSFAQRVAIRRDERPAS